MKTAKQISDSHSKAAKRRWKAMTPAQRSEIGRKRVAHRLQRAQPNTAALKFWDD